MSNQTFVKKDRVSFAVNSNEILTIAPINTNTSILFGSPTLNSNISVVLSNQYIYADGTYLSNLPTAVTTANLVSTAVGLGTFGYISSSQLYSTVQGINSYVSSFIDPAELSSTIIGIVTPDFLSSIGFTSSIVSTVSGLGNIYLSTNTVPSTIVGLGTFGYISSTQLQSTVTGLGKIYLSTNTVPSTIVGLGTFGYISSTQLQSTVTGLGKIYLSTNTVPSTIVGLGTFGYISSTQLQSTVTGLGTFGYISSTQLQSTITGLGTFNYISSFNISTGNLFAYNISSINVTICTLTANVIKMKDVNANIQFYRTNEQLIPETFIGVDDSIGFAIVSRSTITIQAYQNIGIQATSNVFLSAENFSIDANVSTKRIYAAMGNFSSISGNGSEIFALNAISSLSLQSTVVGLGNIYLSSGAGLSQDSINSTIVGLGTFGYLSTNTVPSTIVGLGTFGYLSTNTVPSTIVGLGTFGYLSTNTVPSTIVGLGTFGYLSTNTVPSTIIGLGTFGYLSTNTVPSTIIGLGTFGYLSTNTVPSTIIGLGTFGYLSTNTVPSTIIGLGTFGYLSTNTVPSTIVGLGTFGYLSSFNSISSLNISTGNLFANIFTTRSVSTNLISSGSLITSIINAASYNGTTIGDNINMNGSVFPTTGGGVNRDLGSITNRWNNFFVSTISSIHITTSTILVQNTITASTLNVGAATGTNLAFLNISTNSITGFSIIGTTILSTQAIFCSSLQIGPADAILDILGPLRTQDISTVTCQASTLTANTITVNGIFGGPLVANGTTTQNLNPFTVGAQIGFGSNTSQLGFYSEGHFRSTFTQVIQPTLDNNSFSNIVRINGNISSQNIFVSSIFGTLVSSPVIACSNLVGTAPGSAIYSQNFYPQGVNILGFGTGGPGNGPWDSASIRLTQTSSIVTNNISAGVINVSSIRGDGSRLLNLNAISSLSLESTIVGLGTFGYLSTNTVPSTIIGLGTFGYLSTNTVPSTIIGLGTFGYLSTNTVPSTIIGLGTFGYLSTNTVPSTIIGLGTFGYLSTNTVPSTIVGLGTFGYLSTNTVPSTIIGLGTFGYLSTNTVPSTIVGLGTFGYLSTNSVPSTIDGLGTFGYLSTNTFPSTIIGLGTFGYLSTNIVPSTIIGLGTFGYLSTNTVPSTIIGLGTFGYLSTNIVPSTIVGLGTFGYLSTNTVPSTIIGLGTFGYLSTNTVPSTIIGLGTFGYLSTNTVPSTIIGLGTFGYLSTNIVPSTIVGLGTFGYISTSQLESTIVGWAGIPASADLDMDGKFITNVNQLIVDVINTYTQPSVGFVTDINLALNSIHDVNTITTEYISSSSGTLTLSNSHFIPSVDNTYDLGSAISRWRDLYVAGTSIHLGNTLVLSEDIDGKLSTNAITVSSINVENISTSAITVSSINVGNISTGTLVADTVYSFSTLTSTLNFYNATGRLIELKYPDEEGVAISFYRNIDGIPVLDGAIAVDNTIGFIINSISTIHIQAADGVGINAGKVLGLGATELVVVDTPSLVVNSNASISSINTNFILTNSINLNTIQTEYITSAGGTVSITSHLTPSFDDTYNLGSATNRWRELYVAGTSIHLGNSLVLSEDSSGRLSTNKGIITSGLDLDNNAISNVLQIKHISSATTNLCLPTYKLITTTNPNTYNDSAFIQILVNPNYFTHVIPFDKYRVQLNFSALLDTANTSFSYFYFTLSNYNSTVYNGSIYSATRPYTYFQKLSINTAFNFTDVFDMSATPPNIGDSLYVLLYAKNYDNVNISYSNINCFVVTEPVV